MRRTRVLVLAYASLLIVALASWYLERMYVGGIAVVPLLFIAYHSNRAAALATAFASGILLAVLDRDLLRAPESMNFPPALDIAILCATFCSTVAVAQALRHARWEAESDVLTRIPNRAYFLRRLNEAITASKDQPIAVLFADLDGFKAVNDTAGHAAGDAVLAHAAERLQHAIRSRDVLARLGGDEFAVLLCDLDDKKEAQIIAQHIENSIAQPFHVANRRFNVGITIGTSFYPDDARDAESLLRVSDEKMYRAKNAKR